MTRRRPVGSLVLVVGLLFEAGSAPALAADPPSTINYEGVLRDAADKPRNGTFDMVFRFFDAAAAGNEILVDAHIGGGGNAVVVSNGLFNVPLGGGTLSDGSGAGTYASLGAVFGSFTDVWLEIAIGAETLSPRVKIRAAAYALNAGALQGQPASSFLDTSATPQSKSGPLQVNAANPYPLLVQSTTTGSTGVLGGDYAVAGDSLAHGGAFTNGAGSYAFVAEMNQGIRAEGATEGGVFTSLTGIGTVTLAAGGTGITATGTDPGAAGHFTDPFHSGEVFLATGDAGLVASGSYVAGQFDSPFGQHAYLASDGYNAAGYFVGRHSEVQLGNGPYGVGASGESSAGVFSAPSGRTAYLASDAGVEAGFFTDPSGVFAIVAGGALGMVTNGTKNFIQNHPTEPGRVVLYTALEGAESGTYTRGAARMRGAEVRIALEPTFALTTDPEVGLTAVVTPRSPHADLYVASVSTRELVVRSGSPSAEPIAFDYLVNGLRIGFENQPAIVPSEAFPSATVPTLEQSEARLVVLPADARGSTPLARFAAESSQAPGAGPGAPETGSRAVDRLAGAQAMIAGINSAEHAAHARPALPVPQFGAVKTSVKAPPSPPAGAGSGMSTKGAVPPSSGASARAIAPQPAPVDDGRAQLPYAFAVPVLVTVEAGDVLANDAANPGVLRRAGLDGDAAVVGIVAGPAGMVYTGQAPLALAGTVVLCKVDATERPIEANDLLIASKMPGFARSGGPEPRAGTIVGKALESLAAGTGTIRVLAMSR
ncbi:MAG TPA: hypothetical protein VJV75_07330 [Candidatus Polarisedimenticolia bacterium]|nr:hypothetical protein [Candidatus Polarisedimenticolia bacterium]